MTPSCYSSALTCGVCLEEFHDPRALPCLHTFCLDCLVGLHQRGGAGGGRLVCPCCRRVCQTPAAGPEGLPRNFHVARLREMRPLMQMGQGLAEEFSDRAGRELARLPTETQLRADVADCRRRLTELRASQRGISEFFDAVEEAVQDERETIGEALAEAKLQIKEKRRRAKDCLARRSVSERLLDCAKSDRHQVVLDLIGEFRDKCANNRSSSGGLIFGTDSSTSAGSGASASAAAAAWTPTEAQVRRQFRTRLMQLTSGDSGADARRSGSRQCGRKRRRLRQQKQQANLQRRKSLKSAIGSSSSGGGGGSTITSSATVKRGRKRAESTGSSSRLLDDSEIEELCREYDLAGYLFYEEG